MKATNTLTENCFFQISSYSKGSSSPGTSIGKKNILAKEVLIVIKTLFMCKMPRLHKCKLIMDTNYFIGCMFCLESLQVDGRWAYN